mgnify:CR=1 FL=1
MLLYHRLMDGFGYNVFIVLGICVFYKSVCFFWRMECKRGAWSAMNTLREYPFAPAVYEHKAGLLGCSPTEVSSSAALLAEAVEREYAVYRSDFLTVGVDLYNLELEAMGLPLIGRESPDHCAEIGTVPENFVPEIRIPGSGRYELMLAAADLLNGKLGEAALRIAATGPATLTAKLLGPERFIMGLADEDAATLALLDRMTQVTLRWSSVIRSRGYDVIVFDSMAAPPLFSPFFYENWLLPRHRAVMEFLEHSGQKLRELVIGGDTTPIAGMLRDSGANVLLCDYAASAGEWRRELGDDTEIHVRRNLNAELLADRSGWPVLRDNLLRDLERFSRPVLGTGILSYAFPPSRLLDFLER